MVLKDKQEHLKMPLLSEIITKVDRNSDVADPLNKHRHQVSYSNSRTIIRYIESDVILKAFACNPGNAIVIFEKKNGLIAYGCYLDSFPAGNGYPCFHWTKMDVEKAFAHIQMEMWEESDYQDDVEYKDTDNSKWEELASGSMEYTSSYRNSTLAISEFKQAHDNYVYSHDYSILRLISGRLRVEVDGKYFSYEEFIKIIQFYRDHQADESVTIINAPGLNSWQKVLSITNVDDEILNELKVQVVANKLKEAA